MDRRSSLQVEAAVALENLRPQFRANSRIIISLCVMASGNVVAAPSQTSSVAPSSRHFRWTVQGLANIRAETGSICSWVRCANGTHNVAIMSRSPSVTRTALMLPSNFQPRHYDRRRSVPVSVPASPSRLTAETQPWGPHWGESRGSFFSYSTKSKSVQFQCSTRIYVVKKQQEERDLGIQARFSLTVREATRKSMPPDEVDGRIRQSQAERLIGRRRWDHLVAT